ncbi:MAG TPA: SPOR domain-containing protein [Candidatus Binatia bacterium]|nr:SPOR domain-containing protein [Candidatus Binatia bacterium]
MQQGHATGRSTKLRYLRFASIGPLLAVFVLVSNSSARSFSPDEDLTARAAILMDAATGKVLYQKEADLRLPPASTTKIVTALVALESRRKLSESLKVSKTAPRVPASKLYLRAGQTITIEDLLYAILLSSANDASVVLAEGIAGSVERFAELMTEKAHAIGARNTHFTNPHGLTAADHYSTARDLAILFRYAMKNAAFREIVQTKLSSVNSHAIVKKRTVARRISVRNHNRLLWNFEGALGGKTGYTHAALKCFVGAVQRNGVTLIVAILGARDQWGDTKRLLEYGFDNYQTIKPVTPQEVRLRPIEQGSTDREVPARTAAPQEIKRPSPDGYVLQVGSFRERERAETVLRQFSAKGFEAFVETTNLTQGQITYRVRLGPYAELLQAQQRAEEIFKESGYQVLILPAAAPAMPPDHPS